MENKKFNITEINKLNDAFLATTNDTFEKQNKNKEICRDLLDTYGKPLSFENAFSFIFIMWQDDFAPSHAIRCQVEKIYLDNRKQICVDCIHAEDVKVKEKNVVLEEHMVSWDVVGFSITAAIRYFEEKLPQQMKNLKEDINAFDKHIQEHGELLTNILAKCVDIFGFSIDLTSVYTEDTNKVYYILVEDKNGTIKKAYITNVCVNEEYNIFGIYFRFSPNSKETFYTDLYKMEENFTLLSNYVFQVFSLIKFKIKQLNIKYFFEKCACL